LFVSKVIAEHRNLNMSIKAAALQTISSKIFPPVCEVYFASESRICFIKHLRLIVYTFKALLVPAQKVRGAFSKYNNKLKRAHLEVSFCTKNLRCKITNICDKRGFHLVSLKLTISKFPAGCIDAQNVCG